MYFLTCQTIPLRLNELQWTLCMLEVHVRGDWPLKGITKLTARLYNTLKYRTAAIKQLL